MGAEQKLTGGRVNYYLVQIDHPQREDQPAYQAECEDIIEALHLNPDEANIFKEIWRSAAARRHNGKPGHTALYGAEKIVHYAGRILRRVRRQTDEQTANFAASVAQLTRSGGDCLHTHMQASRSAGTTLAGGSDGSSEANQQALIQEG